MLRSICLGFVVTTTFCTFAIAGSLPSVVVGSSQLGPSTATQTTSLDIWVDGNGATPIDLAGFQLTLSIDGPDDLVKILGFGAPTAHPYLFDPTSTMPSGLVAGDGLSVELGDFLDMGTAQLDDGDGLASLMLEVQPGAVGVYQVKLSVDPAESFLAQSLTEFIAFNAHNGQVNIIPEPSSLLLAILSVGLVGWLRARSEVPKGSRY